MSDDSRHLPDQLGQHEEAAVTPDDIDAGFLDAAIFARASGETMTATQAATLLGIAERLRAGVERLRKSDDDWSALLELQRTREKPWIERWRQETGKHLSLPDYGDMLAWIVERAEAAETEAANLREVNTDLAEDNANRGDDLLDVEAREAALRGALLAAMPLINYDHPKSHEVRQECVKALATDAGKRVMGIVNAAVARHRAASSQALDLAEDNLTGYVKAYLGGGSDADS